MSGSQIVYVEGYFRKDGIWIPPHTREWDGIKNPSPPKRVRIAPSAARPALDAPLEPVADDDDDGPADRGGKAVAAGGDWDDEDFDHLVDGQGEPVERPRVRMAARMEARGGAQLTIPEDRVREWRDADGTVIAVGWLGSRLGGVIWIRTSKGGSVRAEVDDLCAEDRDFLDDMKR